MSLADVCWNISSVFIVITLGVIAILCVLIVITLGVIAILCVFIVITLGVIAILCVLMLLGVFVCIFDHDDKNDKSSKE